MREPLGLGGTHCLRPASTSVGNTLWGGRGGVEKGCLCLARGLQAFLSDSRGPRKPGAGQGGRRERQRRIIMKGF